MLNVFVFKLELACGFGFCVLWCRKKKIIIRWSCAANAIFGFRTDEGCVFFLDLVNRNCCNREGVKNMLAALLLDRIYCLTPRHA